MKLLVATKWVVNGLMSVNYDKNQIDGHLSNRQVF